MRYLKNFIQNLAFCIKFFVFRMLSELAIIKMVVAIATTIVNGVSVSSVGVAGFGCIDNTNDMLNQDAD